MAVTEERRTSEEPPHLDPMLDAHLVRTRSQILSAIRNADMLWICANPGCGVTEALQSMEGCGAEHDMDAVYLSFEGLTQRSAIVSLNQTIKELLSVERKRPLTVVLDELPAIRPSEAERYAKSFGILLSRGVRIVCAVGIENMHLCGICPSGTAIDGADFCLDARDRRQWAGALSYQSALALSAGLPGLLGWLATRVADPDGMLSDSDAAAYAEELDALVFKIMGTLDASAERLATTMLVLGEGSVAEALAVSADDGKTDVARLAGCVPLLGIHGDRFACGCTADLRILENMERFCGRLEVMRPLAKDHIVQLLEKRGDFVRASFAAQYAARTRLSTKRMLHLAPRYLEAGETELVVEAVSQTGHERGLRGPERIAECGIKLMCAPRPEALHACSLLSRSVRSDIGEARGELDTLLCFRQSLGQKAAKLDDAAARLPDSAVELHCRGWAALLDGDVERLEEAMRAAEAGPADRRLMEALEADVAFFAALLGQDAYWPRIAGGRRDVVALWAATLRAVAAVLAQEESEGPDLERLMVQWNDRKDALPRALTGLAMGAAALRDGLLPHAHVALGYAEEAALEIGSPSLTDAIRLLRALEAAGGNPALLGRALGKAQSQGGRILAGFLRAAAEGSVYAKGGDPLPADRLWLLALLTDGPGDIAAKAMAAMPEGWKAELAAWRRGRAAGSRERPRREMRAKKARLAEPALLEVNLLGHFEVKVDGEPILINRWPRRSSKALLQMLAAKRGHTIRRADILSALWPGVDYVAGRPRIYSAVSTLRDVVKQKGTKTRFVLGGDGMISLNPSCVVCDVDRFEAAVKEIMSESSDAERTIEAANEVCDMYRGEMVVSSLDSSGMMVRRAEELRHEYVDALAKAAQVALAEDRLSTAALFARNAYREIPVREDAAIVLLQVYLRQGRTAEAWDTYRSFSQHLMDVSGIRPSGRMRAVMDALWDDTKEGVQQTGAAGRR